MIHSPNLNLTPAELDAVIHINKSNTKHAYEHWAQKYHGTRATFCERLTLARRKLRAWTDATDPGNSGGTPPGSQRKHFLPLVTVEVERKLNVFKISLVYFAGGLSGAIAAYLFFAK